jgi:GrpB-like predicted nucleotidyltransferase (UPF0157 family)
MQVFRFDPEIATTLGNGESPSKLGELLGRSSIERAGVLFLNEGALYEIARSPSHQLIAVTDGACTVATEGLSPFVLAANQAIVVDPHESGSLAVHTPVVALMMEGAFDIWAVAVTQDIKVVPYDGRWPHWFQQIAAELEPFVSAHALRIDHVGSTSVPGLAAKPIIDVDVVAPSEAEVSTLIGAIISAGYRWRGDLGVTGREAFGPVRDSGLPEHHLYLVVENNKAHLDHLLLRDVLRHDAALRDEYATLKLSNVDVAEGNMDVYVAAKANFVARLLTQARRERDLPSAEYWNPVPLEDPPLES